jgi:hypothetical protein
MVTTKALLKENEKELVGTCLACSRTICKHPGESSPTNMAKVISPNAPAEWLPWKKTLFKD